MTRRQIAMRFAAATACLAPALPGQCHPGEYARMMSRLRAASDRGVPVETIGQSVQHRDIPLIELGRQDAPIRVLILCRQHGDEPTSTGAALRLIEAAAHTKRHEAAHNVRLLIVPMVNPDGAERSTRANAAEADLNRDWQTLTQPETRAVARVFQRLHPQVVLDEHEWTAADHRGTESLEASSSTLAQSIQSKAAQAANNGGVQLLPERYGPTEDMRLAHRHFGELGAATFLLETTPRVSESAKRALYEGVITEIARLAGTYAPPQPLKAPMPAGTRMFTDTAHARPKQKKAPMPWLALGAAGIVFLAAAKLGAAANVEEACGGIRRRARLGSFPALEARLARRGDLAALHSQRKQRRAALVQERAAWSSSMSSTSPRVMPARRAISPSATPSPARRQISGRPTPSRLRSASSALSSKS